MDDHPNLKRAVAEVITELREKKGITTQELAHLSGMDRVYLTFVQQGKYRLTLNAIFWLAKSLDISSSALIDLIEQKVRSY